MLNPEDVRHIQDYLRSLPNHKTQSVQPINQSNLSRPKTAVVSSPELYEIDEIMQKEFPTVYDLLGGVEGLLMCADTDETTPISQMCISDAELYDHLSSKAFDALDKEFFMESESGEDSDAPVSQIIYENAAKEYISWEFTETILKATRAYGELLRDCLAGLANVKNDVRVTMLTKTPIKGVYLIRFSNEPNFRF